MFMQGDRVVYIGSKFAPDLSKKGLKIGEVTAPVLNQDGVYVVEFGDDSFIMPERSLQRYRATVKDESEPEVQHRRRRVDLEDDVSSGSKKRRVVRDA